MLSSDFITCKCFSRYLEMKKTSDKKEILCVLIRFSFLLCCDIMENERIIMIEGSC